MQKPNKVISIILVIAVGALTFQVVSMKSQINNLNQMVEQLNIQHTLSYDAIQSHAALLAQIEQDARASYGETVSVIGLSGTNRLVDVEMSFSLKEAETNAHVSVTAKDETGMTTHADAEYSDGVYRAVLALDASKAYCFLYEAAGSKTVSGELLPNYQAQNELTERFKLQIGRSQTDDTFELFPYIANLHNGNDALKVKNAKLFVTEQSPGNAVHEMDLMPYVNDDGNAQILETGWDERTALAIASGDPSYRPNSEQIISYGFPMPAECDFTFEIIVEDNLGYTYRYFETFNRRRNGMPDPASSWSSSSSSDIITMS